MITKFKIADLFAVAFVLIAATVISVVIHTGTGTGSYAVVRYDGGEINVDLRNDTSGTVDSLGYTLEYQVKGGSLSVTGCTCPDKICVRTPAISKPGQSIICLPAHIIISVDGGESGGNADIIAG